MPRVESMGRWQNDSCRQRATECPCILGRHSLLSSPVSSTPDSSCLVLSPRILSSYAGPSRVMVITPPNVCMFSSQLISHHSTCAYTRLSLLPSCVNNADPSSKVYDNTTDTKCIRHLVYITYGTLAPSYLRIFLSSLAVVVVTFLMPTMLFSGSKDTPSPTMSDGEPSAMQPRSASMRT